MSKYGKSMPKQQLESRMTPKGQVTIPLAIRRKLGLKPYDHVQFDIQGDTVTIRLAPSRLARWFGSVTPLPGVDTDAKAEREAFMDGIADEAAQEL